MSYKEGGWKQKYVILKSVKVTCTTCDPEKTDCGMACDGDVKLLGVDPEATYFILRLDTDPHARIAAMAYADSVAITNPVFARDIREKVNKTREELVCGEVAP
jgi:hypothetical protein